MNDIQKSVEQYFELKQELFSISPKAKKNIDEFKTTPCDGSSLEEIWFNFWPKPIRAFLNSNTADKIVDNNSNDFIGAWKQMTEENSPYEIVKKKHKGSPRKPENYELKGSIAKKLLKKNKMNYMSRYYAIFKGGIQFNHRVQKYGSNPFPELVTPDNLENYIMSKKFADTVGKLENEMGLFWGPISICHFMTDCGLSIKPDIHLVTSLKYLKVIAPTVKRNLKKNMECVETVRDCTKFCKEVYGEVNSKNLRMLDHVLFAAGRELKLREKVENSEFAF